MTRNKLLNTAILICKFICAFYIFMFVLFTALFIHFQISPNSYKGANFDFTTYSFKIDDSWKVNNVNGDKLEDKDVFILDKISTVSTYIIYLQFSAILVLIFLCTKEFQKIMESVKSLKTFQTNNVISFRKIGKYIFIIFLLTSYTSIQFENGGKSQIQFSFTPLLFMLFAFIMAEIFKEGNKLKVENDLTI